MRGEKFYLPSPNFFSRGLRSCKDKKQLFLTQIIKNLLKNYFFIHISATHFNRNIAAFPRSSACASVASDYKSLNKVFSVQVTQDRLFFTICMLL